MKNLIAVLATSAILTIGASSASAENFFKKVGREIREAHERHVEIIEDAHDARRDDHRHGGRHDDRRIVIYPGHDGYGDGCGDYQTIEVQQFVEESFRIEYVEVRTPGHFECRMVESTTPGYYQTICVPAVYKTIVDRHGCKVQVLVKAAYNKKVWVAPVTTCKEVKVWVDGECKQVAKKVCVPAHYETKCIRVWVRE